MFFIFKIIGGGDELQGIKRGIMEMVDVIFINKVDQDNLQKAKNTRLE
jgi:LAO/AO transport system kinase